jgi:outer membrane protein OmpA-like peptidoglycan-associated protein
MNRRSYGLVLAACAWASSADAFGDIYLGGQLEAGRVDTQSRTSYELDRKGSTYSLAGGILFPLRDEAIITALMGVRSFDLLGESQRRRQLVQTVSGMIRVDYRWIMGGFEPGILLNLDQGQGTTLKLADQQKPGSVFSIGPEIAYRWPGDGQQVVAYLAATLDVGVAQQNNVMALAGLQYWFKTETQPTRPAEPEAPPAAPPPPVETPPVEAPPVEAPAVEAVTSLRFKSDVFQFEVGSARLTSASQTKAKAVADALRPWIGNWSHIDVEGHTDSSGQAAKNRELSQKRAESIRAFLLTQGLPENSLTARGFGSERPLPQLPPDAPDHRRVELRFHDLKNAKGLAEALQEFLVREEEKP